jgi:Tol biopolymer transport system component
VKLPLAPALSAALLALAAACVGDPFGPPVALRVTQADTAVYAGASYQLLGQPFDGGGNARTRDEVRYRALHPEVAQVTEDGRVTAMAIGRGAIEASSGGLLDTAWVSVVPEGTIVALRATQSLQALEILGLDNSGLQRVGPAAQDQLGAPSWHPSEDWIVYHGTPLSGGPFPMLHRTDRLGNSARLLPADLGSVEESYPRISRDGGWIYFRRILTVGGSPGVWRIRPDGSDLEFIVAGATPDPSPDGTRLAFFTSDPMGRAQIVVRELGSGVQTLVAQDGISPRWSPDGEWIAYANVERFGDAAGIYVVRSDGSGLRRITPLRRNYVAGQPDWSPDGRWIVARADESVNLVDGSLELIEVATGLVLPLEHTRDLYAPSWKP